MDTSLWGVVTNWGEVSVSYVISQRADFRRLCVFSPCICIEILITQSESVKM